MNGNPDCFLLSTIISVPACHPSPGVTSSSSPRFCFLPPFSYMTESQKSPNSKPFYLSLNPCTWRLFQLLLETSYVIWRWRFPLFFVMSEWAAAWCLNLMSGVIVYWMWKPWKICTHVFDHGWLKTTVTNMVEHVCQNKWPWNWAGNLWI